MTMIIGQVKRVGPEAKAFGEVAFDCHFGHSTPAQIDAYLRQKAFEDATVNEFQIVIRPYDEADYIDLYDR